MRCVSPASLNCWLHSSLESCLCNCCMLVRLPSSRETRLTIATVNNGDMVVMQGLSSKFEQANPDIQLRWVVLEENVWRQRTTTDVASGGWAIWCPDNRVLWNADLGKTRFVKTIRSTRQLRRKWPNKTHQRRSFQQRQTSRPSRRSYLEAQPLLHGLPYWQSLLHPICVGVLNI